MRNDSDHTLIDYLEAECSTFQSIKLKTRHESRHLGIKQCIRS